MLGSLKRIWKIIYNIQVGRGDYIKMDPKEIRMGLRFLDQPGLW
jgi:hypothetical protein